MLYLVYQWIIYFIYSLRFSILAAETDKHIRHMTKQEQQ